MDPPVPRMDTDSRASAEAPWDPDRLSHQSPYLFREGLQAFRTRIFLYHTQNFLMGKENLNTAQKLTASDAVASQILSV